jgi:diadenosine tetraphosphate (Ap4A) HIT family hydrolase
MDEEVVVERTEPSSFVVLRTRDVVAFLDILPMTGGMFIF